MGTQEDKHVTLYKGVFWVIDHQIVSEKVVCDECGNMILEETRGFQTETWSNNHKKIWSKWPRVITQGKPYNYFPRGRIEIRNKKAVIFLNPAICSEEIIQMIKTEFELEVNEILQEIQVKADGSWHYKCYCME